MVRALEKELSAALVGGRVERIHQPDREDLVILVYTPAGRHRLFVSVRSDMPRCYLTARTWENPPSPPFFCQLLRRHLEGARITALQQAGIDRILSIAVTARDEVGRPSGKRLILELTGRKSNVILVDADDRIVDAIKRVDSDDNRYREIWPGVPYVPPPPLDKMFFGAAGTSFLSEAAARTPETSPVRRLILDHLAGLGPVVADEVCWRAGADPSTPVGEAAAGLASRLAGELSRLAREAEAGQFRPSLLEAADEAGAAAASKAADKAIWAAIELGATAQAGGLAGAASAAGDAVHTDGERRADRLRLFDTPSDMLDFYYAQVEAVDRHRRLADRLAKAIATERARVERRLAAQGENLAAAAEAENWRSIGEAILANLQSPEMEKGRTRATLTYYTPAGDQRTVDVTLNPSLGPSDNAQAFFRRYARARATQREGQLRYDQSRRDLEYLGSLEEVLDRLREEGRENPGNLSGLRELEAEMAAEGFLGRAAKAARRVAPPAGGTAGHRNQPDRARSKAKASFVQEKPAGGGAKGKAGAGTGAEGLAAAGAGAGADSAVQRSRPYLRFELPAGFVALVGRNNRENDNLTLKVANPGDIWFHTKDVPGSHVILRSAAGSATFSGTVPDAALERAAELAAYYSQARHSSKVSVDYTERRHVRKPPGARPGMVIYDHHQTVYVEPRSPGMTSETR